MYEQKPSHALSEIKQAVPETSDCINKKNETSKLKYDPYISDFFSKPRIHFFPFYT